MEEVVVEVVVEEVEEVVVEVVEEVVVEEVEEEEGVVAAAEVVVVEMQVFLALFPEISLSLSHQFVRFPKLFNE